MVIQHSRDLKLHLNSKLRNATEQQLMQQYKNNVTEALTNNLKLHYRVSRIGLMRTSAPINEHTAVRVAYNKIRDDLTISIAAALSSVLWRMMTKHAD
jgi:hypothetical protein